MSYRLYFSGREVEMQEHKNTVLCLFPYGEEQATLLDLDDVVQFCKEKLYIHTFLMPGDIVLKSASSLASYFIKVNAQRVIVAGSSPGYLKSLFSRAMRMAGMDVSDLRMADFDEYAISISSFTQKAKAIISCSYFNVRLPDILLDKEFPVNPHTLIIGGGIAGIQAALEIARANQKVYLVEKTGSIGGHMAMFDKTFPTLDCAACILTPKMVDVGQNPNIELLTYSQVKEVSGVPGDYVVTVFVKSRKINLSTCIGCGACARVCPSEVLSEFDQHITLRHAAYIPFAQAVPNKYLIDAEHCLYIQKGKCGACIKACPVPGCINMEEEDKEIQVRVGNIIVATGFKVFDANRAEHYGYGKYPNVVTSLEFERLINSAGPTEGHIVKRSQDKKGNWIFHPKGDVPDSVAIIHCVGSRDENYNKYCSKVCCMYSLKLAHLIKEKLPGAHVFEYYIDMRAFGKGYEEFYNRIANEGINIVRGRPSLIDQQNGKLLIRAEDIHNQKMREHEVDMVLLSVGLEQTDDAANIAKMAGILQDQQGWFTSQHYIDNPVDTQTPGITVAGVCQGPADIPDTVAQASAAASKVLQSIIKGKIKVSSKEFSLDKLITRAKQQVS